MSVRIIDRRWRARTKDCSKRRQGRNGSWNIDESQSQSETASRTAGVRIELENCLSDTSRVMPWARAVLLGHQRKAEGFVEPARALQVGTAKHHQCEFGDVRHWCLPND